MNQAQFFGGRVRRLKRQPPYGFTIIELLVVMAVLAILATAVLPLGETLLQAQRERDLRQALWEIRGAIDEYKRAADRKLIQTSAADSGYPTSLAVLTQGAPDARPEAAGRMLYFLRTVPRDPMADPALPAEKTWHLRSYLSSPDRPQPGSDVYDVHSSSDKKALDGSAYSKW